MANKFEIKIKAEKLDKGKMFLHTQLASGEMGGVEFTLDSAMPSGSLILNVGKFEERHTYLVSVREITSALLNFHFDKGKDIKVAEMPKTENPNKKKNV